MTDPSPAAICSRSDTHSAVLQAFFFLSSEASATCRPLARPPCTARAPSPRATKAGCGARLSRAGGSGLDGSKLAGTLVSRGPPTPAGQRA